MKALLSVAACAAGIALISCAESPQNNRKRTTSPNVDTWDTRDPRSPYYQRDTYNQQVPGYETSADNNSPNTLAQEQLATAAGNVFAGILDKIFGSSTGTAPQVSASATKSNPLSTIPSVGAPSTQVPAGAGDCATTASCPIPNIPLATGTDACNDPANAAFPGLPNYRIVRKDGSMSVEIKRLSANGYATTGTPLTQFPGNQSLFQSGYIYKGVSQYSKFIQLGFVRSGTGLKAVVSWPDGSLKQVGEVEGYTTSTPLPRVVTVKFGYGACLVQYGASDGLVSAGTGYLLVP
jgi:hypothetical protein